MAKEFFVLRYSNNTPRRKINSHSLQRELNLTIFGGSTSQRILRRRFPW